MGGDFVGLQLDAAATQSVIPTLSRNEGDAGVANPDSLLGEIPLSSHHDVRTEFHHPIGRQAEIIGGIGCRFGERDEQAVLPARHA